MARPRRTPAPTTEASDAIPLDRAGLEQLIRTLVAAATSGDRSTPGGEGQSGEQHQEEEHRVEVPGGRIPEEAPQAERRPIDWVKRFDSSSAPRFSGEAGQDVEQWLKMLEARFALVGVPECERQRLAAG